MQAGKLDRQITLLSYSNANDGFGSDKPTYTLVDTVWSDVIDLRGRELLAAQQSNSMITTKFRIRYRADIDGRWRIGWKGKQFEIVGTPIEVGRNETLEIMGFARDEL